MRQVPGRLLARRRDGVGIATVVGLVVLLTGLLAGPTRNAALSLSSAQHRTPRPAPHHRPIRTEGIHGFTGPMALMMAGSHAAPDPATRAAASTVARLTAGSDRAGHHRAGGGIWTDSSSPVRNAPSNATTGPAIPPVFSLPGWTIRKVNLTEGTRLRYYLVARPATVSAARLPVLLVLPGRDMTPATIARASGFLHLVGQAVVVFPAGFANSWNAGYCCGVAHLAGVNDVAFLENVVRSVLSREPGTSSGDVYIAGFSNGGRMALDMACADPRAFKGVAAVEAVAVSSCSHTSPVPLLDIASTADPLLTIGLDARPKHIAGHTEITVQAMIDHWRAIEGCSLRGERNVYPVMTYTMWPHCSSGSRVALAVYDGGPHVWPRGGPGSPPAQTVIWDFFHGVTPAAASRSANAA